MLHLSDRKLSDSDARAEEGSHSGSIQAAIARTATRSMALYFARPVRLFRPNKVNGWQTLRNMANQQGTPLTYQYMHSLIKLEGVGVIPKHFVPPMVVNAVLGTILWGAYGEASGRLNLVLGTHSLANAAASGAIAGGCQALVAAPAENVRILLEHGFGGHSWSCAWKEVFRANSNSSAHSKITHHLNEIRQLRNWLQEVGQLAGRGWNGWGWGCAKDTFGFAGFFLIFELSRRGGATAKHFTLDLLSRYPPHLPGNSRVRTQLPAIVNGVTLVTGGVVAGLAYEYVCRPWDIARRIIHLEHLENNSESPLRILTRRVKEDGFRVLFQTDILPHSHHTTEARPTWTAILRMVGRVGPWGIGFLVWETYGSSGLGPR